MIEAAWTDDERRFCYSSYKLWIAIAKVMPQFLSGYLGDILSLGISPVICSEDSKSDIQRILIKVADDGQAVFASKVPVRLLAPEISNIYQQSLQYGYKVIFSC